ncbi:hypothetical protein QUC31_002249 [Theobroma cacao]
MPPPLMELQSNQRCCCAVTIGDDAVISAFSGVNKRQRGSQKRSLNHLLEVKFVKLVYCSSFGSAIIFSMGNRDANCFFMEMLVNTEAIGSGCSYYEPGKSDYCLCLAIHAPRKGIVEACSCFFKVFLIISLLLCLLLGL